MAKKGIKIVTIGGGSSYTPELTEGFIKRYDRLPITEHWLVDIPDGKYKVETVGAMAQRQWDASGHKVKVHVTMDRKKALKDADFVTTQFRVGLLEARIKDERIPASYGMIGQETNGAGGMFKAFRTIPVILSIVEDMKKLCPNAWLINFTNPSGMVTEAVVRYGHWDRVVGLCNVGIGAMMSESEKMGYDLDKVTYKFAGLNHFHWHKVWDENGKEITQKVIDKCYKNQASDAPANIQKAEFLPEQLDEMKMIPCGYHRYYYRYDDMLKHCLKDYKTKGTRGEQVKELEDRLFKLYENPELNYKPKELEKRGGAHYSDVACETIASINSNTHTFMVTTTKNNGAIPQLPADVCVEVGSYLSCAGPQPAAWGELPPQELGWLQCMKNMELCVEEAAVTGDYQKAVQAFILNPLVPNGDDAIKVLNELLIAHEKYLPQFKSTIKKLKAQGVTIKDKKVAAMVAAGK